MASAYATFAARGVYHEPFFVSKITNADGDVVYSHVDKSRPAFDSDPQKSQDIADNVTEALKPIPEASHIACASKRECAGKTGTHELPDNASQNSKAWMVGYTPSLSAAVWMGRNEGNVALQDARGNPIFGSGLPGQIWKKFMDKALNGAPMERFPKARPLGQYEDPKPTTTATPTTTTDKKDNKTTTPRQTTTDPQEPTTTTRTGKPCTGMLCPTTPTSTTDPQPPGGGAFPTG
jgi:membrane peptidoglycan carboxypeptidase